MLGFLRAWWHFLLGSGCALVAVIAMGACSQAQNIHDTPSVRAQRCIACHAQAFVSAQNPKHVGALPETCNDCHTTRAWIPSTVSGNVASHPWFPLVNKHANVACATCHTTGYKKGDTPTDCVGCHRMAYDQAMKPPHMGFPTACNSCHNDTGWVPAMPSTGVTVDHHWFPLANKHATAACASCHTKGYQLGDTPTDCAGCHQTSYDMTTKPPHKGVFPATCANCHGDSGWVPATPTGLDHHWFPLANKHATAACASCHTKGYQLGDTPKDCAGCHQASYDMTTKPPHKGVFPTTCANCHGDSGWVPATPTGLDHHWFPLANKHATAACASCHTKGYQLGDTPTDCVGCHKMSSDAAMNPPHASLPTTCNTCHNDSGWYPSTYLHPWPLAGKHATTPCVSCHTGTPPRYANTQTACAGCHSADFQRAVSMFPAHSAYPMTCADCHSTTLWTGASGGTHPEANFPIKTGSHSNAAIACADCHVAALGSPVKGQNTDCVHCHIGAHQRAAMDAAHARLQVVAYPGPNAASPNFCLSCHQKG